MPVHSSDALVLRTYRYGEADCIVVFLTADRGKKRGVAKHAVKSRRRFGGALEPLTRGRVTYAEREHRELVRLDRIEPAASPMRIADPHALALAAYVAELLAEWAPDGAPNERLFRLGAATADALGQGGSLEALARYFEYWLLRLEGIYPTAELGAQLSDPAAAFLERAARVTPADILTAAAVPGALREIEHVHQRLITMHLDKELRSVRVMRELRARS
jgi:DNA repair protein RecO (recombination protein O)